MIPDREMKRTHDLPVGFVGAITHAHFPPLVKQVVSVEGDENRKNINYTRVEPALRDTWRNQFWFKLTPKPVLDWGQDAKTGAVAELELRSIVNRHWSTWLMLFEET